MDLSNQTWDIINSYFRDTPNYLVRHHIDSYNDFISQKIPLIFQKFNHLVIYQNDKQDSDIQYQLDIYFGGKKGDRIKLTHPVIHDPGQKLRPLYPNEARLKNLTYGMDLFYDIEIECTIKKRILIY